MTQNSKVLPKEVISIKKETIPSILVLDALRNQRFLMSQKFTIFEDIHSLI